MYNYEYEKNKVVKSLKNEIFGLEGLLKDLHLLKKFDFNKWDGKVINVRLEKALQEGLCSYIKLEYGMFTGHYIKLTLKDRYNKDTQNYIGYYDSVRIELEYFSNINDAGKELNRRLAVDTTKENLINTIKRLENKKRELEKELDNIDTIIKEIAEIENTVKEWRDGKSSFLLDVFKNFRNFY